MKQEKSKRQEGRNEILRIGRRGARSLIVVFTGKEKEITSDITRWESVLALTSILKGAPYLSPL